MALLLYAVTASLFAQHSRITTAIDNSRRARLTGHLHPLALPEYDRGRVDPEMELSSVTLVMKQSANQQADLDKLLADQQDPASPNYHNWLTPEQYADRFGISAADMAKVVAWLEKQGLDVKSVARGRNWVTFGGTAGQVETAFGTELHHYLVRGEKHFANATAPSIPVGLDAVVSTIHGLNNFRLKPRSVLKRSTTSNALLPQYTNSRGDHYLSPDDIATLYNLKPLYAAGVTGTGQKVAIAGQTQLDLTDIQYFRNRFNLPASDPQTILIPGGQDPGIVKDDLGEADLDVEVSGALAPNATVIYVYGSDVMNAVKYAIDQNLAPVLSLSYGLCESDTGQSDASSMQSWARQANAQGMTWISASGDSGGADCSADPTSGGGLAVDVPAAIPEVTGVGGTELDEGSGQYWNNSNNPNGGSIVSYVPEMVWNDSDSSGLSAGGGGASTFFLKPTWQTGAGVPNDNARDVPDVALASSADHDGYMVRTGGQNQIFGGTSAAAPALAGIAVLINQYLVSNGAQRTPGLGNINPKLYALAQSNPSVFHDVLTGNNSVTITCVRARRCTAGTFGYSAAEGYDQASGLGSVDAYTMALSWAGSSGGGGSITRSSTAMTLATSSTSIQASDSVTLTATVKSSNGGTPTGTVTFYTGSSAIGSANLAGSGASATAALIINGGQLKAGTNTLTARYSGDSSYNTATATASLQVTSSGASGPPAITGLSNGASFRQVFAPGMILSIFGTQLARTTLSAASVPLPLQLDGVSAAVNGIPAPLYYVSPTQLNIQIPYETIPDSTAALVVNNNGQTVYQTFAVSAAAPGLFVDGNGALVPFGTAARGKVITLFVTGQGAVSPLIGTGEAPAAGSTASQWPAPTQSAQVTVGNVPANIWFIGIPPGLVGVTQINYEVPLQAPLGKQPVVVSIGNGFSAPAILNVTE